MLAVIYLVFNKGYIASGDCDLMRPDLCVEAIRLGPLCMSRGVLRVPMHEAA